MKDKETPLRLVRKWRDTYPTLDGCAAMNGTETSWPSYCLLPINAAFTLLVYQRGYSLPAAAEVAAEITACWSWRQNKVIYRFDHTLAKSLAEQAYGMEDTDVLPVSLLLHLPYPVIYIKAPGLLDGTDGFFAWVDYDVNRSAPELRIQWALDGFAHTYPHTLHLIEGGTIKDCVMDTVKTTKATIGDKSGGEFGADYARPILLALQLILYLLAQNAEIEEMPGQRAERPERQKRAGDTDKVSSIKEFSVGVRIGAAFRKAAASHTAHGGTGTGAVKRPHTRRGHWHHYWTGPKDGERTLILKWTAPTVIHGDGISDDDVVIVPVSAE